MSNEPINDAIQRAILALNKHESILDISAPTLNSAEGTTQIEVTIQVPLPNIWRSSGKSPNGVLFHEKVRFVFPNNYPLSAPEISLRKDFGRGLAHIQPWTTSDGCPIPCLIYGDINEFTQQFGILGIVDQLISWLTQASEEKLIDPAQGWEPMRRDNLAQHIVVDEGFLRSVADNRGGNRFLDFRYHRFFHGNDFMEIHGKVSNEEVPINKDSIPDIFIEEFWAKSRRNKRGKSLALLVWPGKEPSGKLKVCSEYRPDNIESLGDLKELAKSYSCFNELEAALKRLGVFTNDWKSPDTFCMPIILCARRPFNLIGRESNIELVTYLAEVKMGNLFPSGDTTPVSPVGIRQVINSELLALLNGHEIKVETPCIVIGAGSLGSKISLHMGRAGRAPSHIIDNKIIYPHNFARHSLIPLSDNFQLLSTYPKALLLTNALINLGQQSKPLMDNVIDLISAPRSAAHLFGNKTWAIINTTASLTVRESLNSDNNFSTRVIEAALYSKGKMGLLAIEGKNRNPKIGDLLAEFYAICQERKELSDILYESGSTALQHIEIGQGCGSITMQMSDATLSMFAASMAEYVLDKQKSGLPPESGEIIIGTKMPDDIGATYLKFQIPPLDVVTIEENPDWKIHIHDRAKKKIEAEVKKWPGVETGGIIVGRISEKSKTFNIVDVIDAPDDSTRSAAQFSLGTKGVKKALEEYGTSTNWALYYLGTWHNHLVDSGPSEMDRDAAKIIAKGRSSPSILLIHTPSGYRALMADPLDEDKL